MNEHIRIIFLFALGQQQIEMFEIKNRNEEK